MKRVFLYVSIFFFLAILALPVDSQAHDISLPFWGAPLVSCGPGTDQAACTSLCDLIHTVQHVIYFGMTIALFVFAPIFFAWGGLMILISGGSDERRGTGKQILTGTVIGVVIVLAAFLIVSIFLSLLGVQGVGFGTIECSVSGIQSVSPQGPVTGSDVADTTIYVTSTVPQIEPTLPIIPGTLTPP